MKDPAIIAALMLIAALIAIATWLNRRLVEREARLLQGYQHFYDQTRTA